MLKAQSKDRSSITHLLAQSFDDNKSVNYIIPQGRHRPGRLLRLMEYSFDYCQLHGNVYLSDDRQGTPATSSIV